MSYTALYRKFRPAAFEDVRGQEHIVTTLKNQIKAGRIGHAYLFCGTRGTGKTTVAKILAKAVNCENPVDGSPCGSCASCRAIASGSTTNVIEIDAASNNSVDNVREIREQVAYRPTEGRYKVYIIDEVHMLSTGAFNALLKTLEEPPEYVIFILATTEAAKIPVTILSRCQRYDFRRMNVDTIAERIRELLETEHIEAEEAGIRYIARMADGSMRDALSLLDQCISCWLDETLTYDKILEVLGTVDTEQFAKMLDCVAAGDVTGCIRTLDAFVQEGKEMAHFASDFTWYLRNLLLIKNADGLEDILDMSTENLARLKESGKGIDDDRLMRYIRIFSELTGQLRTVTQKRIYVELALIRMCRPQMETDAGSILQRLSELEKKAEQQGFAPVQQAPAAQTAVMQGGSVQNGAAAGTPPAQNNKIRKAAPEELVQICARWPQILSEIDMPLLRSYLNMSSLRYDGDTGENRLFLVVDDVLAYDYLQKAEARELIIQKIASTVNRTVEVEILKGTQTGTRNLTGIPIVDHIKEVIDMPVEIEM